MKFHSDVYYDEHEGRYHLGVPYWDHEPWPWYDYDELIDLFSVLYEELGINAVKELIKGDVLRELNIEELRKELRRKKKLKIKWKLRGFLLSLLDKLFGTD